MEQPTAEQLSCGNGKCRDDVGGGAGDGGGGGGGGCGVGGGGRR